MIKKLIYIIILFIFCSNLTFAQESGTIEYNNHLYKFKKGDEFKFLSKANNNMLMFENAKTASDKNLYLQNAMLNYFLLSKVTPSSIEAQIGLAKIYDELKLDSLAKKTLLQSTKFGHV